MSRLSRRGRRLRVGWLVALAAVTVGPALGAEIEITTPTSGAKVSGVIEVSATITPEPDEEFWDPVLQTIDGQQIELSRQSGNQYTGKLDTTRLPNGRQVLLVWVSPMGASERREGYDDQAWDRRNYNSTGEVRVVVRNPYNFYWGDIHAHTSYSDGAWFPNEAYEHARDKAKLDFFAVTDHLEIVSLDEYGDTISQANTLNEPGRFVTLYGVERTRGDTGHICFYMSDAYMLPADLSDCYRAVGTMGILGHFNHPWKAPPEEGKWHNDFQGFRYAPEADRCMALVEVRNEREEECYIAMLDNGWHVGAAGDEDQHSPKWGEGPTWTVALARSLTRDGILEALWARRTYSTADRNLRLTFTVAGEDMGSQIARPAGTLTCAVAVSDPDAGDVVEGIALFVDGRVANTVEPGAASYGWEVPVELAPGKHYCFVRVTQPGDRMTWSSPVWVTSY